ncbi:MAG TPA: glycosyltransferase family 39 protein [Patescibacteria group bacterium]|nr:glycosyltransferase family 39 protein [Patescibacteria group bacterium]
MQSNFPKQKPKIELALVIITGLFGLAMYAWVQNLGLVKFLTDQNAHLDASRLVFDSMTPGISQIGFWPPLLHILMMPFTLITSLYQSGGAGAVVLIPALMVAAVFLYRLAYLYTNDKFLSFVAALLLVVNPYILYFSVTPMMEVLFLANLFGTAYFLAEWLAEQKLKWLVLTGVFVTLTCLSRFEGLILIPLVSLIIFIQLTRKRKNYSEKEAVLLLFLIPACLGLVAIFIYSWVFGGSPLAFTGGSWIKNSGNATAFTKGNVLMSVKYLVYSSFYMLSKPLVWVSVGSLVVFAVLSGKKFRSMAILTVLASPFVFVLMTLVTGTGSVLVANLPPYNFFSNERYSLTWIGFTILVPVLLISAVAYYFSRSNRRWMGWIANSVRVVLAVALLGLGVYQSYQVVVAQKFSVIKDDINSPLPGQVEAMQYLANNYDYGKILLTKADNDPILSQAHVPLSNYIYEGNYKYFDQADTEPWLFARYIVMHNPDDNDAWSEQNDEIMVKWGKNPELTQYYDLVMQNPIRRIYKIDDAKVMDMAAAHGLDASQIPSINPQISWWDPSDIYAKIQTKPTVGLK